MADNSLIAATATVPFATQMSCVTARTCSEGMRRDCGERYKERVGRSTGELLEVRQQVVNAPQRADVFFCSDYLGQSNQPLCAVVISTNQLCYNVGITDN